MKLKECEDCYYKGIKKCFFYNKEFEKLNIEKCHEGFTDPYEYNNAGELCKTCHYYETNQCMGNEIAKENCLCER